MTYQTDKKKTNPTTCVKGVAQRGSAGQHGPL